jgi:hypothetical protein
VPLPGSESRHFPETGKTVSGVFLRYWETHGGLAQQGYPISEVMGEISELDGKPYTIQYFERAVFEYHPENAGTQYEVLLSQLGTFQYRKKYPNGASNQRRNSDPGTRCFAETGKCLGGAFHHYWVGHGGLMQQGYPISDEFIEISPLDGKPYTVQYFERAVFEYHPENRGTVYEVLLSHLGRFRWDERYSVPSYTTQLIAKEIGTGPVRAGKYLIWKGTTPNNFIYVYNLENGRMASTPAYLSPPGHDIASDGATVVWKEGTSIVGYDIDTGRRWTVLQADTSHGIGGLALDAGVLYYVDETYERTTGSRTDSLYSLNLTTQEKRLISSQGQNPVARDGVLLWRENKNGPFYPPADLHALRLDSSDRDRVIATLDRGLPRYDVSDDKVAWTTYLKQEYSRAQDPNIHLYDLATGTVESIPAEVDIYARPLISGNRVVWTQELGAGGYGVHPSQWKIWEYNVSTRQTRCYWSRAQSGLGLWRY